MAAGIRRIRWRSSGGLSGSSRHLEGSGLHCGHWGRHRSRQGLHWHDFECSSMSNRTANCHSSRLVTLCPARFEMAGTGRYQSIFRKWRTWWICATTLACAAIWNRGREVISERHCARKSPTNWYRTIDRITPSLAKKPKLSHPGYQGRGSYRFRETGKLYPHHNLYLHHIGGLGLAGAAGRDALGHHAAFRCDLLNQDARRLPEVPGAISSDVFGFPFGAEVSAPLRGLNLIDAAMKRDIQVVQSRLHSNCMA
jgi:hypothetical protein